MAERTHKLYFGQKTEAFTTLGSFEVTRSGVSFSFDTWPSIASFDAGDDPIERLEKRFEPDAEFRTANRAVLDSIQAKVFEILGLGATPDWLLLNFYINTTAKVLTVTATSSMGDSTKTETVIGAAYDALIADNQALVAQVLGVAWTFGKTNDAYLAETTAV